MKHFLPVLALLIFPACAALQQSYIDSVCNNQGAYNKGYNDGHRGGQMDSSFTSMCPADQDSIGRSYQDGFSKGTAQRASEPQPVIIAAPPPPPGYQNQPTQGYPPGYTPPPPGYDDGGGAPPGRGDGWICRDAYGERHCGYDCREAYGQVKCAQRRRDNCVAAFGVIKCGLRCRENYGEVVCDRYE